MADENKPKIDLKSRLGRKTVSSPSGPSIPPPVGGRGGIPAPPFATRPSVPAAPYSGLSASAAPPPPPPQPQAIKVEMSEEVIQAQKKSRSKMYAAVAAMTVVGGIIGYAVGGGSERSTQASVALQGAQDLAKEIDEANAIAEQISEVVTAAQSKLAKSEYPEAEISKLGALRIPFEGTNLAGKGIGRFKGQVLTMLISYTSAVDAANKKKETVQRILTGSKKALQEMLAEKEDPKVSWAVYVAQGPGGPWAGMQPLPTPFPVKKKGDSKYAWPEKFEIKSGNKTEKLDRYTKGDPSSEQLIPVAPETHALVCPADTLFKLARELRDLGTALKGAGGAAGEEDNTGVITSGQKLIEVLKGIGAPS